MSRDTSIRKSQVDPALISLPFLYINPQFGYSVNTMLRDILESPDCIIKEDAFPYDIKEYYWIQEGIPGEKPWYALGYLNEDMYFFYKAFTYSTFDKDGHMDLWLSYQFGDLIQYAMDTATYNTYITSSQGATDSQGATSNQNKISDGSTSDP